MTGVHLAGRPLRKSLLAVITIVATMTMCSHPVPAAPWTVADCSRSLLRCNADYGACEQKLLACDKYHKRAVEAWDTRLAAVQEARRVESAALNSEILALKRFVHAPRPWVESPVLWGVVGVVVGIVTTGAICSTGVCSK